MVILLSKVENNFNMCTMYCVGYFYTCNLFLRVPIFRISQTKLQSCKKTPRMMMWWALLKLMNISIRYGWMRHIFITFYNLYVNIPFLMLLNVSFENRCTLWKAVNWSSSLSTTKMLNQTARCFATFSRSCSNLRNLR